MSGLILGSAYEPGRGVCNVEQLGTDAFLLTPVNNPANKVIRYRREIRWRSRSQKEKQLS